MVKKLPANAGDAGLTQVPWVAKIPWRIEWQLTPVFLLGKSHEQRSLVSYKSMGLQRIGHDLAIKETNN